MGNPLLGWSLVSLRLRAGGIGEVSVLSPVMHRSMASCTRRDLKSPPRLPLAHYKHPYGENSIDAPFAVAIAGMSSCSSVRNVL